MIPLDREKIARYLKEKHSDFPMTVSVFESIDSTNAYLLSLAKKSDFSSGCHLCFAEHQSAGRGRLGRTWESPPLENLYFSGLWRFNRSPLALSGLSLVIALIWCEVLHALDETLQPQAKWPNDIILNHKKLAGILLEVNVSAPNQCDVVVGMGVNVNSITLPTSIEKPWTSLYLETEQVFDRHDLIFLFLDRFFQAMSQFNVTGFKSFEEKWRVYDYLFEKEIKIQESEKHFQGIGRGVNHQGHLLLEQADGQICTIISGEASTVSALA
jgi:BirA family transcriptional regulator, biotin operon repressor / biotin---[acetyl-CoA-carboxylase] ligase